MRGVTHASHLSYSFKRTLSGDVNGTDAANDAFRTKIFAFAFVC